MGKNWASKGHDVMEIREFLAEELIDEVFVPLGDLFAVYGVKLPVCSVFRASWQPKVWEFGIPVCTCTHFDVYNTCMQA